MLFGKTEISLFFATGFDLVPSSSGAAFELPPAVSVRLYVPSEASLGPPPGGLPEGLPAALGFGFGLLPEGGFWGGFAAWGFGFGVTAEGVAGCFSVLAGSAVCVMITSLKKG